MGPVSITKAKLEFLQNLIFKIKKNLLTIQLFEQVRPRDTFYVIFLIFQTRYRVLPNDV